MEGLKPLLLYNFSKTEVAIVLMPFDKLNFDMSNTKINNNSTLHAKLSSPAACISIKFGIKICAASIDLTLTKKANHHGVIVLKCSTIKVTKARVHVSAAPPEPLPYRHKSLLMWRVHLLHLTADPF